MDPRKSVRDQLLQSARLVELETGGKWAASKLRLLIDDTLVPQVLPLDEVHEFMPLLVSLNRRGARSEFPDASQTLARGAVACLGDRAVFGWITGSLRLKRESFSLNYHNVTDASVQLYRGRNGHADRCGVDIVEAITWSVLMPVDVAPTMSDAWATNLVARLHPSPSTPRTGGP